jgi:phosphopantothenoylcysteine decarboxylase/phosphopantothenate--cysteine ligase
MPLNERKIILGVCGGVAAYKSAELLRQLRQQGARVQVVMTASAQHFVGAATFQALSGQPVFDSLWDTRIADGMAHIALSRDADAIVVAPVSAHRMAQIAQGMADDLLSTLILARPHRRVPLLLAPAMNVEMWENPATQRHLAQLRADGVHILGPAVGPQACGETGPGRLLEPEAILAELIARFQPQVLQGRRVVITAGPTYEALDPVRGITNRSSGKMGYALARAAHEAGARVDLVSGPTALPVPHGVNRVMVDSARQMLDAVNQVIEPADVFISVAAVADWRPESVSPEKIKKTPGAAAPTWSLVPNPDILATVSGRQGRPYCVGFAAESEHLIEHAQRKRHAKNLDLIIANQVRDALGKDEAELILIDANTTTVLPVANKLEQARRVVQEIGQRLGARSHA